MNNKINWHRKVLLAVACLITVLTFSCSKKGINKSTSLTSYSPVSSEALLSNPFGYKPTIKNFKQHLPSKYRPKIYPVKNIHNPNIIDTIYQFVRKNNEIFIYKTRGGSELFFAANIYDSKIVLRNGVRTGMARNDFFKSFANYAESKNDSIVIKNKQSTVVFSFIFKNDKLQAIKMNNYID